MADISELLDRVQSPDGAVRNEAENVLKQMESENYSMFLISLCATFASEDKPLHIQRLAVIIFKNVLGSKERDTKAAQAQKWMTLDGTIKSQIRSEILRALHHQAVDFARTVSMLIAKVAGIDLPTNQWPELIPTLLNNMTITPNRSSVRQATLETLGYICEELSGLTDFELDQEFVNAILTAVVGGMQKDEKDDEVRLAATKALSNALDFAHTNFSNQQERTYIMNVVCEGTLCETSEEVRVAAYECLIRICQTYYEHLPPYIETIMNLTMRSIQHDVEDVAKQAIEFWSTISEEELELEDDLEHAYVDDIIVIHHFVRNFHKVLMPILLQQMLKQEEDQEVDETAWTVSMAASTCLELMALCVGNECVPVILEFCNMYMKKTDGEESWRYREAAMLALGSVLQGCDSLDLLMYLNANFHSLLQATKDPHPAVRNTAAWTLGRVFEFMALGNDTLPILSGDNLSNVFDTLTRSLNDEPHVVDQVCFAIGQLANSIPRSDTLSLSPYFAKVVGALLDVALKRIPDRYIQSKLQVSAFDAINGMIKGAPDDCLEMVRQLVHGIVAKLEETMSAVVPDDAERISDLQGLLCGSLGVVLRRLEASGEEDLVVDINTADTAMQTLLTLLRNKHATVQEEAMLTVGSLSFVVKQHFNRYLSQFMPILEQALRNHQDIQVCISTIGTLSNVCQAVMDAITPFSDPIMDVLIATLRSSEVNRDIKPHILSTMSDIAMALGNAFGKYLSTVATIIKSAIEISISNSGFIDEDLADYNNELRKGILDAFSGILQGIGQIEAEKCLYQESKFMIDFLERVVNEAPRDSKIKAAAVGLLGDIAHSLPSLSSVMKHKRWIEPFIQECFHSSDPSTKATARWTATTVKRALSTTATSA